MLSAVPMEGKESTTNAEPVAPLNELFVHHTRCAAAASPDKWDFHARKLAHPVGTRNEQIISRSAKIPNRRHRTPLNPEHHSPFANLPAKRLCRCRLRPSLLGARAERNPIHRFAVLVVNQHPSPITPGQRPGVPRGFEERRKLPRIAFPGAFHDKSRIRLRCKDVKFPIHFP